MTETLSSDAQWEEAAAWLARKLSGDFTEAENAQAAGVQIDVVPLWYEHRNEVYFDKLVAPTRVAEGDVVPLRMLLHAERATSGHVEIYHNGRLVEIPKDASRI